MSDWTTVDNSTDPDIPSSVSHSLACRPTFGRSITAPVHQPLADGFCGQTPASASMAAIHNQHMTPHGLCEDDFSAACSLPSHFEAAWPMQDDLSLQAAAGDTKWLNANHCSVDYTGWGFRTMMPNMGMSELDFHSDTSQPLTTYTPGDDLSRFRHSFVVPPHIKAEDADDFAATMSASMPAPTNCMAAESMHMQPCVSHGMMADAGVRIKRERCSQGPDSPGSTTSYTTLNSSASAADIAEGVYVDPDYLKRIKRSYTTEDTAKHECETCHKMFQRGYNLRAHLQIHDPMRTYPHGCVYPKCYRRFVRQADLQRHIDSVHVRNKRFPCPQCGKRFTRKDTARRHTEDGCPHRRLRHDFDMEEAGALDGEVSVKTQPQSPSEDHLPAPPGRAYSAQ